MDQTTVPLAVLIFALVATRLAEERRWREGHITDQRNALLVVGRLPLLVVGFMVITGQPPLSAVGATLLAVILAGLLYRVAVRRLRQIKAEARAARAASTPSKAASAGADGAALGDGAGEPPEA